TAANAAAPAPNEFAPSGAVATTPAAPAAQVEPLPLAPTVDAQPTSSATESGSANVLGAVRLLLKETKTGLVAGKLDRVAEELGKSPDELLNALTGAGLKVPEKPREKPVFVE